MVIGDVADLLVSIGLQVAIGIIGVGDIAPVFEVFVSFV